MNYKETEEITNYIKIEMQTTGDIMLLELYPDIAPITVKNFQKLVSEKFYDGLVFHRIIKDFMIQGGDPLGNGSGGSEETIKGEFRLNGVENNLKHERGVISMARSNDRDSASSQFFIVHADSPHLDGSYASFGRIIAGLDTLDKLANTKTNGETPITKPVIYSIRFVTVDKQ
ncbi:MAG: peptidylprolyl isomerase [Bacilli bacterium]|nr:peptidylprolyl isomerase [Bacilli bacterium]